jgi:hypothetical protein
VVRRLTMEYTAMPRASHTLKSSVSIAPTMMADTPDCLAATSQLFSSSLHTRIDTHTHTYPHIPAVSALHGVSDGARKVGGFPLGEEALVSAGERAPWILSRSAPPPYNATETNCCTAAVPVLWQLRWELGLGT